MHINYQCIRLGRCRPYMCDKNEFWEDIMHVGEVMTADVANGEE